MPTRRDFLHASALASLVATSPAFGKDSKPPHWKRYRQAFAIDGAGGIDVLFAKEDDPQYADFLEAMRTCNMTGVVMTIGPYGMRKYADQQFTDTKQRCADWSARIARVPDQLLLVKTHDDLERARRERKIGVVYTFQGAEPIGENLDNVAVFREAGVRVIQLTHNFRNLVGDGSLEPGNAGLSRFGHALVERLNAERIVVDVAHGSQRTMREGILASTRPPIISHSGCRALADTPRLVYDEELKLLADRGGVIGIIFWPYLRTQGQQMAEDILRHVDHAIDVCGEDHVGFGTDLSMVRTKITPEFRKENAAMIQDIIDQGIFTKDRGTDMTLFPADLNMPNRFEILAGLMTTRGYSDARIEKVLGGNFARVLGEVWG